MKPLFIISLPRSGSTLLQSILATSHEVKTHPEMWFNLGLASLTEPINITANYSIDALRKALVELDGNLKKKDISINRLQNEFGIKIYESLSDDKTKYVIDKTPRYFFIINYLAQTYPDSKFIFIVRDPLEIIISYKKSFNNNNYHAMDQYYEDFRYGFKNIINGYNNYKERSIIISYNNIVKNRNETMYKIFDFLDLNKNYLPENYLPILGEMGDKNIKNYKSPEQNISIVDYLVLKIVMLWLPSEYLEHVYFGNSKNFKKTKRCIRKLNLLEFYHLFMSVIRFIVKYITGRYKF